MAVNLKAVRPPRPGGFFFRSTIALKRRAFRVVAVYLPLDWCRSSPMGEGERELAFHGDCESRENRSRARDRIFKMRCSIAVHLAHVLVVAAGGERICRLIDHGSRASIRRRALGRVSHPYRASTHRACRLAFVRLFLAPMKRWQKWRVERKRLQSLAIDASQSFSKKLCPESSGSLMESAENLDD